MAKIKPEQAADTLKAAAFFAPILLVGVKKTALAADGKVAFQLIGK